MCGNIEKHKKVVEPFYGRMQIARDISGPISINDKISDKPTIICYYEWWCKFGHNSYDTCDSNDRTCMENVRVAFCAFKDVKESYLEWVKTRKLAPGISIQDGDVGISK